MPIRRRRRRRRRRSKRSRWISHPEPRWNAPFVSRTNPTRRWTLAAIPFARAARTSCRCARIAGLSSKRRSEFTDEAIAYVRCVQYFTYLFVNIVAYSLGLSKLFESFTFPIWKRGEKEVICCFCVFDFAFDNSNSSREKK